MLFREVLREGFFGMIDARDKYRELTANEQGMHATLIRQFIEWQATALGPICPHISEHVWMDLLGKKESLLNTKWPQKVPRLRLLKNQLMLQFTWPKHILHGKKLC